MITKSYTFLGDNDSFTNFCIHINMVHLDGGSHLLVPELVCLRQDDVLLALLSQSLPAGVTMPHWLTH